MVAVDVVDGVAVVDVLAVYVVDVFVAVKAAAVVELTVDVVGVFVLDVFAAVNSTDSVSVVGVAVVVKKSKRNMVSDFKNKKKTKKIKHKNHVR